MPVIGHGVEICTSTTRPTIGITNGTMIYETDTNRVMFYNGSIWLPPKGTIAQVVSFNGLVSDNTTSTGYVDSNFALSITPTTNTNSRIIANFSIAVYVPAANNGIAMAINKYINGVFSANMVYASTGGHNLYLYSSATGQHANVPFAFTDTPNTTGVVTYRAVFRSYNGGTVYLGNGGNTPCTGVLQEIII